ncbi:MAG: hypothetical protein A2X77_01305 [Gammaproteobacteria bacterium GWE2_42_36]|nr:MAG: hypothetical protein A2X77_01305 [Gammaproteobacteria bacterium GWE2_42_36]HCU05465.1 hypothetical protein [Coxiellaceae bacterium]
MDQINLDTFLATLVQYANEFEKVITGACVVIGVAIFAKAIFQFKSYADFRMMSSSAPDFKKGVVNLIVAVMILYVPSIIHVLLNSFFNAPTPMAYAGGTSSTELDEGIRAAGTVVQIVGLLSFIRGWLLLSQSAEGGQQGSFGRAITLIICGVLSINVFGVFNILNNTFFTS